MAEISEINLESVLEEAGFFDDKETRSLDKDNLSHLFEQLIGLSHIDLTRADVRASIETAIALYTAWPEDKDQDE